MKAGDKCVSPVTGLWSVSLVIIVFQAVTSGHAQERSRRDLHISRGEYSTDFPGHFLNNQGPMKTFPYYS